MLPFLYSYSLLSCPSSLTLATTDLFFISPILPFQECCINGIKVCSLLGWAFLTQHNLEIQFAVSVVCSFLLLVGNPWYGCLSYLTIHQLEPRVVSGFLLL